MASLSLMPNYLMHQWQSNGLPLSGGVLYFYESGTFVPKSVYSTADGSIPLGTSVTLSASGTATIFLGEGAYRIWLKDSTGAQIEPYVDGIIGSGSGGIINSNATIAIVKLYSDLRALTSVPDVVYVSGNTAEGDGGEGLFQLLPLSTLTDDGGVILTSASGTNVYRRVFDGYIDPRWYGVTYTVNTNQSLGLNAAISGSVQHNYPILVTGPIYVNQNISVTTGASIKGTIGGYFHGSSTMTFAAGSNFDGESVVFGLGVQPVFDGAGICDVIRLSWMGNDTESGKWSKLIASTTYPYSAYCDIDTTLTSDLTVPSNFSLDFVGGSKVIFNAYSNLSIGKLAYSSKSQIFQYNSILYVGSVALGADKSYIEWFGGVSEGDANTNAIAFKGIAMNGYWDLLVNSNYTITNTTGYTTNHELRINGNGSQFTLNQHINLGGAGIGGLWMTDVRYNYSATGSITAVTFIAKDSYIYGDINCDTNLIYDSQVNDLDNISLARDSKFFEYTGHISGNVSGCEIYANGMLPIDNTITIQNSNIVKTDSTDPQKQPLFDTTHNIELLQCTIDTNGLLVYSTDSALTITLTGCYSPNNFANALSNGYAKVNLNGCGAVRCNTTAFTVEGVSCRLFEANPSVRKAGLKVSVPAETITGSLTGWYGSGVGSMSTDGTSLTLGDTLTLDNTPWGTNTIRLAPCNSTGTTANSYNPIMDLVWRYGGQITIDITYPNGTAADPTAAIAVAFVVPKIGSGLMTTMTEHHILSVMTPVNLSPVTGAVAKNFANIWGGQVDIKIPSILGATSCADEWGDVTFTKSGDDSIPYIPRIVIYNSGTGSIPAGTKITMVLGAYMPNTLQYQYYWPETPFAIVNGSGWQSVRQVPKNFGGLWKTPYSYRCGDANGVQIAVTRPYYYVGTQLPPFATDLPVTVWANGTTLNGSYS